MEQGLHSADSRLMTENMSIIVDSFAVKDFSSIFLVVKKFMEVMVKYCGSLGSFFEETVYDIKRETRLSVNGL